MRWIRLSRYCALTDDTPDAVHARRRKGQWTDGLQCRIGPDGNLWINPEEVNRWVEGSQGPAMTPQPSPQRAKRSLARAA
jgi:hypothetical protein